MATEVKMPNLGYTMEKGKILEWLKTVGDRVEKGEPLLKIETDKVVYEVESPVSGILQKTLVTSGEEIPVGVVVAIINGKPAETLLAQTQGVPAEAPCPNAKEKVPTSPLAKKLAKELGIDLARVKGSGPAGRISREDVLRFAESLQSSQIREEGGPPMAPPGPKIPDAAESIELSGVRGVIARRMMESLKTTAQLTQVMEADVTDAEAFRKRFNQNREEAEQVSFTDLLIKATALALKVHPLLNATLREGKIHLLKEINIGLATDTPRGLMVPVIHGADRLGLSAIHRRATELIRKAREAKLMPGDLAGGTFTITNMGSLDITVFTPILNPPESAILGVGKIVARPAVVEGEIAIRQLTYLSLTFDHRVVDGAPAALFQKTIRRYLESPYLMVD